MSNSWGTFFSKAVAVLSLNPFLVADITEFSTKAKRHAHVCSKVEVEIFIGTGALLGIFAYICRQQPIIHCIH